MSALERFLNGQPVDTPPLVKAGLAHVQFGTIHPFLDGNGRVGRLLIALELVDEGVLRWTAGRFYDAEIFEASQRTAEGSRANERGADSPRGIRPPGSFATVSTVVSTCAPAPHRPPLGAGGAPDNLPALSPRRAGGTSE